MKRKLLISKQLGWTNWRSNFELSEEEEDEMADFEVAREQRLQMGNGDYDEL